MTTTRDLNLLTLRRRLITSASHITSLRAIEGRYLAGGQTPPADFDKALALAASYHRETGAIADEMAAYERHLKAGG